MCRQPRCAAIRAAYVDSSVAASSKPIVNVRTGSRETRDIAATTADESTPPERNAPSGTSAIMWRSTTAVNCSRKRSIHSASLAAGASRYVSRQKRSTRGSPVGPSTSAHPGSSLRTSS